MITPAKWQQLKLWMTTLKIDDSQIEEQFILGSGRGGQKLQKTSSCVQLQYKPFDLVIKCADSRSRETNRYRARMRLCEKVEAVVLGEKSKAQREAQKVRKQKARRSKRAKQKILDDKRHQSKAKERRKRPEL
jgi:peptide chain release factor